MSNILSVPGKIYPGFAPELTNQKATEYNDLRHVMAVKPEILEATSVLFAEQYGVISEIMTYLDARYSPGMAAKSNKYRRMEANIKLIGNHEYAWRLQNPSGFVYQFTRAAEGPGSETGLGVDGTDFIVYLNRLPLDQDDVIELADNNTHIMLVAPPEATELDYKCRVRLLPEFPEQVIPPFLLDKGKEACYAYNIKPEASEHGSKVRTSFGAWMSNYMTTMRFEWNMTGTAAHTKNNVQWLVYTNPQTSKLESYWMPIWDYQMMAKAQRSTEHFLFNGKKAVNPNGKWMADRRGKLYFSGDGLYTQCSKKLRIGYNELVENDLETMMKTLKLDSLEIVGKPQYICLGGLEFRLQFDKLLRRTFNVEPHVLFHADSDGMKLKSNFVKYEIGPLGEFYCLQGDFFDSKYLASYYDNLGVRMASYRGIVINVSELVGGQKAAMLVSREGRQNVVGRVAGMSNPGPDGVLSTTLDAEGKHLLKEIGIAAFNPYCLGEFYKPFKQY